MLRRDGSGGVTSGASETALTFVVVLVRAAPGEAALLLFAAAVLLAALLGLFDTPRGPRRGRRKKGG